MSDLSQRLAQLSPEKRALLAKRLQEKAEEKKPAAAEPLAIVGMSCRFPGGANSPEAFWQLLKNGVDAITEVPRERWESAAFYDPDPEVPRKMNTRWGGFLKDIDQFDPNFFNISPREAAQMDPQQRMLLETAWEALEAAGQTLEGLRGSATGVFVGIHSYSSDYGWMQLSDLDGLSTYTATGTNHSIMPNRISYWLDLRGPSLAIDTACSSSLVAVHLACQSLRAGECRMALVGGANLMLRPEATVAFSKMNMMSADGRCKAFDARADGFVRSEGVGMIVIKRLSDARADRDPILALIRGSAVNQDGATNGITAPNSLSQIAVVRTALQNADVRPEEITYVETHGTGTILGDPIEVEALTATIGQPRANGAACVLGSVKTNIGHLEGAAGIAGLIKTVLCLQHGEIPPHLHFTKLNPHLTLANTPFEIHPNGCAWPRGAAQRIAGISSFGFGGTNAHVVISDRLSVNGDQSTDHCSLNTDHHQMLPLSARSPEALRALVRSWQGFLRETPGRLHDLCYTASVRRTHHEHRLAFAIGTLEELAQQLENFLNASEGRSLPATYHVPEQLPGLAFVFSGQGPQWFAMGRQLMQTSPVFRGVIEACDERLRAHAGWSLLEELQREESASRLDQTEIAQPALFALQIALAELWRSWGIVPDIVLGHSVGEVAAAFVAGALSLEQAVRVIYHRGRLMQRATGLGKMAQVELDAESIRRALEPYRDRLALAASNSPSSTVVAGEEVALEELLQAFEARNIEVRRLRGHYAFHSPQMEPYRLELAHALHDLRPRATTIPMLSTVTGKIIRGEELEAAYWGRNLRETVAFAPALENLLHDQHATFLELSPHPVLAAAITKCAEAHHCDALVLASLRRGRNEYLTMLTALGALYTRGYAVDWKALHPQGGRCIDLPSYPWQRRSYWIANDRQAKSVARNSSSRDPSSTIHDLPSELLGVRLNTPQPNFQSQWRAATLPFIAHERREGEAIFPAPALIEMALAAAQPGFGAGDYELQEMIFHDTLALPEENETLLHLQLRPQDKTFEVFSSEKEVPNTWALQASGKICAAPETPSAEVVALEAIKSRCAEELAPADYYPRLERMALQFGAGARGLVKLYRGAGEAFGEIQLREEAGAEAGRPHLRIALLDHCLQLLPALLPNDLTLASGKYYRITQLHKLRWHGAASAAARSHAILRECEGANELRADLFLYDAGGRLLLEALDVVLQSATRSRKRNVPQGVLTEWLYEVQWQARARRMINAPVVANDAGHWLILSDRAGFGEALAKSLMSKGHTCDLIFAEESTKSAAHDWQQRLQQTLAATRAACKPRGLVHMWNLEAEVAQASLQAVEAAALRLGCASLLQLLQAATVIEDEARPRLWVITKNAQAAGTEPVSVAGGTLWGMGRTIALEHPEVWGGQIDLGTHSPAHAAELLAQELLRSDGEDQIAFRAEQRFVARLQRPQPTPSAPVSVREDRAYLITGSLGSLGLRTAAWLAEHGAKHIALLSRRKFPARAQWPLLPESSPWNEALATLRGLEEAGVRWQVYAAEVGDVARMAGVFAELQTTMPPLAGVFHAAGISSRKSLRALTTAELQENFQAKVQGAWILHQLTRALPLDFFVLYSSVSAVWGAKELGHYAAANHFLDTLAHHRRSLHLPALSVNWGPWAGGGMAGEELIAELHRAGLAALQPHEALAALGLLLGSAAPQMAVAKLQWPRFKETLEAKAPRPLLADWAARASSAQKPEARAEEIRRQLQQADPETRRELLARHIQQQAAQTLGLPETHMLEPAQGFFNMGMDSIMAVELKNRLEKIFGVDLPRTVAFEHPSIARLAAHLDEKIFSARTCAQAENSAARNNATPALALAEIQKLSEIELAAIVDAELAQLRR